MPEDENEQHDRIFAILKFDKDKLVEWLEEFFGFDGPDGTYAYWLTRVKSGFTVDTISVEDFEEFGRESLHDLATHLLSKLKNPDA